MKGVGGGTRYRIDAMVLVSLEKFRLNYISPTLRLQGVRLLLNFSHMGGLGAIELERKIAKASCNCERVYLAHLRRQAFNIACSYTLTAAPPERLFHMTDEEFAAGTMVERVHIEEQERMHTYTELLKEKYDNVVRAQSSESILKCRNCGSSDINWSQKQTRGADEGSTIFCTCQKCSKRWRFS